MITKYICAFHKEYSNSAITEHETFDDAVKSIIRVTLESEDIGGNPMAVDSYDAKLYNAMRNITENDAPIATLCRILKDDIWFFNGDITLRLDIENKMCNVISSMSHRDPLVAYVHKIQNEEKDVNWTEL